jgi:Nucleoside-diphosphate-sugar epimerases
VLLGINGLKQSLCVIIINMSTALVTGAAGFIGSHLSEALLDHGYRVRGVDTFETGRRRNLESLTGRPEFSINKVDIRNRERMAELMDNVEFVFHEAAVASVPQSVEAPVTATATNCTGTAVVLDAARRAAVDSVVVASSSAIYGSTEQLPKVESMPVQPESPYALSKHYTEELAVQFSQFHQVDTVALRYFNVFGPRQDPTGDYAAVVPKFIDLMTDGERPVIYGDGEQSRDFVYIDDVVRANVLAAESNASGVVANIASGEQITVNELVAQLNSVLNTEIKPVYDDPRPGDVRHSVADLERARAAFGYEPEVGVRKGLEQTVDWFA